MDGLKIVKRQGNPKPDGQRGIALLEALIAILLFSMGVLALVGLQSAMIKNTATSQFRAQASYVANQWVGFMWADVTQADNYLITDPSDPRYDVSSILPMGTREVTKPDPVNFPNQYQILITWQEPGKIQHRYVMVFTISS